MCEVCGKRVEITNNKIKYCDECAKTIQQNQKNQWKREEWKKNRIFS
jgi:ribosome-binding protein aMBF1 (putative translation factor)